MQPRRTLPAPTSSSVAQSAPLPSIGVDASTRKGKDKDGLKPFRIFKPFLDREFPEWSKPRAANLDLGNYRVDDNATILGADEDDDDTIDLAMAPGLKQFVDYGVQAKQGVTDAKGKAVDPPKPLEATALVPHVVSASLARYYRLLPHKPPVGRVGKKPGFF